MRPRPLATCPLLTLLLATTSHAAVPLVEDGSVRATVVCADSDKAAAEEFVSVVQRMSDATLPISPDANTQGPRVLIGAAARSVFEDAELAELPYDAYRLRARGDILALAGRTPAGTMNAVCGFLQDHLGARWFMPSELFEVLPARRTIRIDDCDERHAPSFDCRLFSGLDGKHQQAWQRHLRLSSGGWQVPFAAGFRHNLYRVVPPSKYAQTDPDIYPILNGERVTPTDDRQPGWQPCTANPRTVEIAIDEIRAYFDQHPDAHSYSLSINDNNRWCECDLCAALDVPHEFRGRQCYSDRYYTFVNAVARGVAETHPDRFVGCFAYAGVEPPPMAIDKLEPNVFVNITQDTSQYFDAAYREQDYDFWRQWQAKCRQMGKYDYSGLGALAPRYYPHLLAEDLRHSKQIGLVAMHTEAYPYWSNYGPMIYLDARLMWDVTLDEDELLAEFFDQLYGPAAPEMAAFYDELERTWMTPREGRWFAGIGSAAQQCDIYTLQGLQSLKRHLRSAARLAPEGVIADRIAYIRRCFEYPALFIRGWLIAKQLGATRDPEATRKHVETLTEIMGDRDAAFQGSVMEDALSTSWYKTHAGRERVQSEWRSTIQGALLTGVEALAEGGAQTIDQLIAEMSRLDPNSALVLGLRARRGDFDSLPNLVKNPGFEESEGGDNPPGPEWEARDAPPGWSVWRESPGSGRIWRDTGTVRSGSRSAALTGGKCMCYITRIPVTPGKSYVGWAHIRAPDVTPPRRTTFEIRWNNAGGAWHAAGHNVSAEATRAGEWTRLTAAATAPDGAASAIVLLVVYGIADDETAWFDDVFFTEAPVEGSASP